MIKKTIKYKNYADEMETEDFYFHLSEGELTLMQLSAIDQNTESFQDKLDKIAKGLQGKELAAVFQEMIELSYGEKTTDGKRFDKDPALFRIFKSTGAYSVLVKELINDHDFAIEFINGLMPSDLKKSVSREVETLQASTDEARRLSEGRMQGYQKKAEPSTIQTVPELPAAAPILETPEVDLSQLSADELRAMIQSGSVQ
jgi:hypothetical protein